MANSAEARMASGRTTTGVGHGTPDCSLRRRQDGLSRPGIFQLRDIVLGTRIPGQTGVLPERLLRREISFALDLSRDDVSSLDFAVSRSQIRLLVHRLEHAANRVRRAQDSLCPLYPHGRCGALCGYPVGEGSGTAHGFMAPVPSLRPVIARTPVCRCGCTVRENEHIEPVALKQ